MLFPTHANAATRVTLLAPAFREAERTGVARGIFFSQTYELIIGASEVLLSSSPDGAGALCTDDQATLSFRQPGAPAQEWSQLFADPAGGTISCTPPQRLRLEAGPGRYVIEVTLSDRFPFTFSSRPYFLIVPGAQDEPAALDGAPLIATRTTPPLPPTGTATVPALPAGMSTAAPALATPTQVVVAANAPAFVPPRPAGRGWLGPTLLAILAASAVAIVIAALGRRQPAARRQPLRGIVDLFDRRTGERRTALLQGFPNGAALVCAPLGLVAADVDVGERVIARIVPGPGGPQLRAPGPAPAEPTALREGETVLIDRAVELRYRGAPAIYPQSNVPQRRR